MKKNLVSVLCAVIALCVFLSGVLPGAGLRSASAEASGRWLETADGWMYLEGTTVATGWKQIGGGWYWFDASGIMADGWKELEGVWYYFDNGKMVTGTVTIDGTEYLFDESGAMQAQPEETAPAGWLEADGLWSYYLDDGSAAEGWQEIDGLWYYFKDGVMQTGWLELNGTWYYLAGSGAMVTGKQEIDGTWYVFDDSGAWQEDGLEITLFGAPWRASASEVVSTVSGIVPLEVSKDPFPVWPKEDTHLTTGGIDYREKLGFHASYYNDDEQPFLFCGYPVDYISYYFLYTPDESGTELVHDADHSTLIYADVAFEDSENIEQMYSDVLKQLTAEYGNPADHTEEADSLFKGTVNKKDFWTGANGTRMALWNYQYQLSVKFAAGGTDPLLEEAYMLEHGSLYAPADGMLHYGDGKPKLLESFSVTPAENMYYIIHPLDANAEVMTAQPYVTVGLMEDNQWSGDQLVIFKGDLFTGAANVHTALGDYIKNELDVTMLPDSSLLFTSFEEGTFASKKCKVFTDSAWAFTLNDGEGPYGYFFRIINPDPPLNNYFFVVMTLDGHEKLESLQKVFEGIVSW